MQRFCGDEHGNLRAIEIAEVQVVRDADGRRTITPVGESLELPCDLALLAIGFEGVEQMPLLDGLGLDLNRRGALGMWTGLADHHAGSVRLWRRPPRRVADRVGDRGRPQRGARGRRLPDGGVGSARAGAAFSAASRRGVKGHSTTTMLGIRE